jgi:hypothetical protein
MYHISAVQDVYLDSCAEVQYHCRIWIVCGIIECQLLVHPTERCDTVTEHLSVEPNVQNQRIENIHSGA